MLNNPWEVQVRFGKITTKDTWRDLMRFFRLLVFDLMPDNQQLMQLLTDYLEWVRLALRLSQTDASLLHAETYCEAWLDGMAACFGPESIMNRIKAHAPTHLREMVKYMASVLFNDDALGESGHIEGAKEPWERTNHINVAPQMAAGVARRDTLRLLRLRAQQLRAAAPAAAPAAPAAPAARVPAAPPVAPTTKLMVQKPARYLELGDAAHTHRALSQLLFSVKLYLHLAQGGQEQLHTLQSPPATGW